MNIPSIDSSRRSFADHKIVVLLIDDQRIIGEAVKRMLMAETDIEYHYTCDPNEALSMALKLQPTVILQDLVMPDIDGITLVRAFRSEVNTSQVPMIVLSSNLACLTKTC